MNNTREDEESGERCILKEGERIRVPMVLMDSAPRPPIHDGMGNAAGHKPGYCFSTDAAAPATREVARSEYLTYLKDAWRGGNTLDEPPYAQWLVNAWRQR